MNLPCLKVVFFFACGKKKSPRLTHVKIMFWVTMSADDPPCPKNTLLWRAVGGQGGETPLPAIDKLQHDSGVTLAYAGLENTAKTAF